MNKMLDHGETLPARYRPKESPFVSAAGLVLGVGMSVLGLIGKGIKGAFRLLLNAKAMQISSARLRDEDYIKEINAKGPVSSIIDPRNK